MEFFNLANILMKNYQSETVIGKNVAEKTEVLVFEF